MGLLGLFNNSSKSRNENVVVRGNASYSMHTLSSKNIKAITNNCIILAVETTGLNSVSDRIVELAAIHIENGKVISTFTSLIHSDVKVSSAATKVNGITNDMLKDAPYEADVCKDFFKFLSDALDFNVPVVGYNVEFDMEFLCEMLKRNNYQALLDSYDLLSYVKKTLKNTKDYKQTTISRHLKVPVKREHKAINKANNCFAIMQKICDM